MTIQSILPVHNESSNMEEEKDIPIKVGCEFSRIEIYKSTDFGRMLSQMELMKRNQT